MARRRVDRLGVAGGGPVAPAIIGRAKVRAAFQHLARNADLRLAGVVALRLRPAARIVAVEASAGRLRGQRLISDVGRHQPKVDDRVQGHREQSAPEARVNLRRPAKSHRQDDAEQLDDDPAGRPSP
jgi:hypothetical protein